MQLLKITFWSIIKILFCNHLISSGYNVYSEKCMGTDFKIIMDHDDRKICSKAAKLAFKECHRLNRIFSDYIADSEISLFSESSHEKKFQKLSPELFHVLKYSKDLARKTNGAFDPTLGRLSRLWRVSRFRETLPSRKMLDRAMESKGFKFLLLRSEAKEAKLLKPGMILDLGGIAKGYAADKMLEILTGKGLERSIIDAGGDLILGAKPRGKQGWKIDIGGNKNPELPVLLLEKCAIATSGDSEQFVEIEGMRYSHILNPKTGLGLQNLTQVTVVAANGMYADSMATACSVLGVSKSKAIFCQENNFKAYFIIQQSDKNILKIIK